MSKTRVALVGDSITELSGYPDHAAKLLGPTFEVRNFGVSGSNVLVDAYYPYLSTRALSDALAFQPDIVVVMLGTNDANYEIEQYMGNFEGDYIRLIQKFQALPTKPRIWLAKPPHIYGEMHGLSNQILEQQIIPSIEHIADNSGFPLIDVYSALNSARFFFDGVHSNDCGARVIAQVVCRALSSN
ncbi:MAG: GDSL-type esterase/lipase family protein [Candidatus Bathyarchaeota archaeon]|nr:GDSL-type esterase/lipase family protein [Candidatus Bathyarchaeota archaeon]